MNIAKLEFDFMGTSVICRSGSPLILADLKKVILGISEFLYLFVEIEEHSVLLFHFIYSFFFNKISMNDIELNFSFI